MLCWLVPKFQSFPTLRVDMISTDLSLRVRLVVSVMEVWRFEKLSSWCVSWSYLWSPYLQSELVGNCFWFQLQLGSDRCSCSLSENCLLCISFSIFYMPKFRSMLSKAFPVYTNELLSFFLCLILFTNFLVSCGWLTVLSLFWM